MTAAACQARLAALRAGHTLGLPLEAYEELPSTNDRLRDRAVAGAPEGATVLALSQTRGRGRRGRAWQSAPGRGLYLSVLLRPDWPAAEAGRLAIAGGLAVARALDRAGIAGVAIKHPNDVLVHGRKIAGVLIEPRIGGGRIEFAVVGIGLNLAQTEDDWSGTELAGRATSCALEGRPLTIEEAATAVLDDLDTVYRAWHAAPLAVFSEWHARGGGDLPGVD